MQGGPPVTRSGHGRPTIYDVAEAAGVSHMTVSRVLNDSPSLRDTTRDQVLAAINSLGYVRSPAATALAIPTTGSRLGILAQNSFEDGVVSVIRGISEAARAAGWAWNVVSVDEHDDSPQVAARRLGAIGTDALCVIATEGSPFHAAADALAMWPTVIVSADADIGAHTTVIDQRAGAAAVVTHLALTGHERIAHLAGPDGWVDSAAREQGWRDALRRHRLPELLLSVGDWTSDAGHAFGRDFHAHDATAVFAANDRMALGVIHGLLQRGIRVPDDVSVVGFGDTPDSRHFRPSLTTVRYDFDLVGRTVLRMLNDIKAHPQTTFRRRILTPELVIRESSAELT